MVTRRFIQVIGNMVVRELSERHPSLTIVFFCNKRGEMMRVFIADKEKAQYTGRLYDVAENPGVLTLRVRELSEKMQRRIEDHIQGYLQAQSRVSQ